MAKDLEKALVNPEAKLEGVKKPHMDLGAHLEYIESLLERGAGGSGGGSEGGSGGGSGGGSVELLKPILTEGKAPVPNTGYVDKVFFNTKLTTDEVDSLIANANLPFINDGAVSLYPILGSGIGSEAGVLFVIMDFSSSTGEAGSSWAIADMGSETFFYTSSSVAADFGLEAGWNALSFTSFDTGEVTISGNLIKKLEGITFGIQNDALTDLIYLLGLVDSGETEVVKSLTDQYKLVETNLKLDTQANETYTYDFINNINEDTKEINVIKNIEINAWEDDIISGSLTTYTNHHVRTIKDYAFYRCQWLTDVSFPQVEKIYQYAFSQCTELINIDLPLVTFIDVYVFYKCSSLINVNLPLLKETYNSSFEDCTSLENITAPKLVRVSHDTFKGCISLTNVNFPNVARIETNAFTDNAKLKEIYLPKTTVINNQAFSNCFSLVKVFLPNNSVCTIDSGIFDGCCHILGIMNSNYNREGLKDGYIYVPASLLSRYKVNPNWKTYASQIIGFEDLEAGATLPNYTTSSFTKQTWYSDEKLTNVVTSVATTGRYYCRLEA